jgi:FkbM family methyltransferase
MPTGVRSRSYARAILAPAVHRLLRRAGYQLQRYQPEQPKLPAAQDLRLARLLRHERIDLVLDIGANTGQYARRLRQVGYTDRIVSVEPLSEAFNELERRCAEDPVWSARRLALGDRDGATELHVSANSCSSSLLQIRERHLRSAPEASFVSTETVPILRLGSLLHDLPAAQRIFLKLDVQGYEMRVLRGAGDALNLVQGIQAELPLVSLYDGDSPWYQVIAFLASRSFELVGVDAGFEEPDSGRMLQLDATFTRTREEPRDTAVT